MAICESCGVDRGRRRRCYSCGMMCCGFCRDRIRLTADGIVGEGCYGSFCDHGIPQLLVSNEAIEEAQVAGRIITNRICYVPGAFR